METKDLTSIEWNPQAGRYEAETTDGEQYAIDADVYAEWQQQAEADGVEDFFVDTSMDGVYPINK